MNINGSWTGHCYYPPIHEFVVDSVLKMTLQEHDEIFSGTVTEICRIEPVEKEGRTEVTEFCVSGRMDKESGVLRLDGKNITHGENAEMSRCVFILSCEGEDKLTGTFADPDEKKDVQQAELYREGSGIEEQNYRELGERILRQVKEGKASK